MYLKEMRPPDIQSKQATSICEGYRKKNPVPLIQSNMFKVLRSLTKQRYRKFPAYKYPKQKICIFLEKISKKVW